MEFCGFLLLCFDPLSPIKRAKKPPIDRFHCLGMESTQFFIFKLEEEVKSALLLLLPALIAESPFFVSGSGLGCLLVVAFVQAKKRCRRLFFMPVLSLPILCLTSN
jgi:hypothetical protein